MTASTIKSQKSMAMFRVWGKTSSFKENIVVQIRFKSESFFSLSYHFFTVHNASCGCKNFLFLFFKWEALETCLNLPNGWWHNWVLHRRVFYRTNREVQPFLAHLPHARGSYFTHEWRGLGTAHTKSPIQFNCMLTESHGLVKLNCTVTVRKAPSKKNGFSFLFKLRLMIKCTLDQ